MTSTTFHSFLWLIETKKTVSNLHEDLLLYERKFAKVLREMKDVFKELKILAEKGKVALHKLTKIYWKQYLQEQARLVARF